MLNKFLVFRLWFSVVNNFKLMLMVSSTNVAVEDAVALEIFADVVVGLSTDNLFGRWIISSSFLLVTLKILTSPFNIKYNERWIWIMVVSRKSVFSISFDRCRSEGNLFWKWFTDNWFFDVIVSKTSIYCELLPSCSRIVRLEL